MDLRQLERCDDPSCPGFGVFESDTHGLEVQRCDTCKVFETDEDAEIAALMYLDSIFCNESITAYLRDRETDVRYAIDAQREIDERPRLVDVCVEDEGTVITIEPVSPKAKAWIDENVEGPPSWAQLGPNKFACDHRPGWALVEGITEAGLKVAVVA
jgi:hypothetical protein